MLWFRVHLALGMYRNGTVPTIALAYKRLGYRGYNYAAWNCTLANSTGPDYPETWSLTT